MKNNKYANNINLELGKYFIKEHSYDLALNALTKAISQEPNNANLYDFRGIAYGSIQEHEKAIADFSMAISIDNQIASAYNNRSLSYWALDMICEAENDINSYFTVGFGKAFKINKLRLLTGIYYDYSFADYKIEHSSPYEPGALYLYKIRPHYIGFKVGIEL